jgi:hypothetical protein
MVFALDAKGITSASVKPAAPDQTSHEDKRHEEETQIVLRDLRGFVAGLCAIAA